MPRRRGVFEMFAYSMARALVGRHRKPRPVKSGAPLSIAPKRESFIAETKELAAKSDGSVRVLEASGTRRVPLDFTITPLPVPTLLEQGNSFISAEVDIEGVRYGFHAYPHLKANGYTHNWLYYSVTGPGRETFAQGEFEITDDFRWTGSRPLNPMLVKYVLREWVKRPEVVAAVDTARRALPFPAKKPHD